MSVYQLLTCDRQECTQTTIRELAQNWCLTVGAIDFKEVVLKRDRP
ncbi:MULTISPECIES: hypothetical protein [unclassified Microcoleus]|nr:MULTISPECIES: hypothetical protein [unclassified Microcoleus]